MVCIWGLMPPLCRGRTESFWPACAQGILVWDMFAYILILRAPVLMQVPSSHQCNEHLHDAQPPPVPRCMQVAYVGDGSLALEADAASRQAPLMITRPPDVRWSRRSHKVFPAAFRAACATLLLCHQSASGRLRGPVKRCDDCPPVHGAMSRSSLLQYHRARPVRCVATAPPGQV